MPDFTVASGSNTSTSIQIVNGKMTTTQSFSYTLIPNKVGKLTIGSLIVHIKGKDYKTDSIIINVVQNPTTPQQPNQQQQAGQMDLSQEL